MKSPEPLPASITSGESGVLQVSGDLTFATVSAILKHSRPLLASVNDRVVMELADVGRVDSAGLALLVQWMRMAREQKVKICFRHVPEQLLAIAHASDLDHIIPLEQG
ncbi:MAG: STAS domain-containing protein [Pseudomonadota bacterium]